MKKRNIITAIIISSVLILVAPQSTFAQITNPVLSSSLRNLLQRPSAGSEFFSNLLSSILTTLLIFGVVAFLFILVFGAYKWISAGGDKVAIQKAREHITHSLVGIVILLSVFTIYNLVGCFFGIGPCRGPISFPGPPPVATPAPITPTPTLVPGDPTPTPIPTAYTIVATPICSNGATPTEPVSLFYNLFPLHSPATWIYDSFFPGTHTRSISIPSGNDLYVGLQTEVGWGETLIPTGTPPHLNIVYYLTYAMFPYDDVPYGTYQIDYLMPSQHCPTPTSTPTSTPTPGPGPGNPNCPCLDGNCARTGELRHFQSTCWECIADGWVDVTTGCGDETSCSVCGLGPCVANDQCGCIDVTDCCNPSAVCVTWSGCTPFGLCSVGGGD